MNKLIMTVGLPRCGKSTWSMKQGHPVVNPDSIRLALHGQPFIGEAEPFVWAIAKTMVRSLFLAGHEVVILDATNLTRKRRDEWKSDLWEREFKKFLVAKIVCIRRAMDTDREYLIPVIEKMSEDYEPVEKDEEGKVFEWKSPIGRDD
jgi:predicted kinase